MSDPRLKAWREGTEAVRDILWADWNPIGFPVPPDEYDAYIPDVLRMLGEKASIEIIARYLMDLRKSLVGHSDPAADQAIAAKLFTFGQRNP